MANLLDWNTLDHKVKSYIDADRGIDKPQKAFPVLMVATLLDVSDEEAADAITDGGHDRGADAVFVDDRDGSNSIHVFQFKYTDKFEKTKNNFPSNEIDKLVSLFADILDEDKSLEKTCNAILWNKIKEIWSALDEPNPSIEVHFCGNMEEMSPIEKNRADIALQKFKYFNVNHHSLSSIVDLFIDKKKPHISDKLTVVDTDIFDRSDGDVRGLICTVEAAEIVRIITNPDDPKAILTDIFDDNVRVYLSRNNRINRKIIETALSDTNALFWYLNNGLTITCDAFGYPKGKRAPNIQLDNIQIVNGGQTSHALFDAYHKDPEKLRNVLVLVRIIETKSKEISSAIAESTNSQTPIKGRDLRSNDEIQKKIAEAFDGMGLFFERKSNQHRDRPKNKRVDAWTAGQARLAYDLDLPEVAKKDRARIYSDLYDTVFTDELIADQLLVSFRLLEAIEKEKTVVQISIRAQQDFDKTKMFLIDGAYHVLFAVGQLCEKSGIDRIDLQATSAKIPEAIQIVSSLVQAEEEKDETFSFNRFFKDAKTKTKIASAIVNQGVEG